jgi:outer membrane lipoprotein-sorting protein
MRVARLFLSIAVLFLVVGLVRPGEQPSPQQIIAKAIKAHGGEANLRKYQTLTMKDKGTMYADDGTLNYTADSVVQGKDRLRFTMKSKVKDKPFQVIVVVNGDKGWLKINDQTKRMSKDQLEEQQAEMYAGWLTTLVPLKEKGFQLSAVGEIQVEGKPALGVRVRHAGYPQVNLFFDKKNGMLIKSEYRVGKETTQDIYFKDFKDADGVKYPSRIRIERDGKRFIESHVTEMQLRTRLDEGLFREP